MIGKVIVGIVIAIVTGGLVLGAVNRTASRDVESSRFNAEEHEIGSLEVQNGDGYGEGRNGEQGESYGAVTNGNQGDQAGFQSFESNESAGEGLAVDADGWSEVIGIVTSIDPDLLQIQLEDNSVIEISRRAWWFSQEQGFSASIGDQVNLTGFFEGDEFETAKLDNLTTGFSVAIRDENGRPLWAGKGG